MTNSQLLVLVRYILEKVEDLKMSILRVAEELEGVELNESEQSESDWLAEQLKREI